MLNTQYENISLDSVYIGEEDDLKPLFISMIKPFRQKQKCPNIDFIDLIVQPNSKKLYRAWQIFFIVTTLFFFIAFTTVMICINFKPFRRFIMANPLIYGATWSFLLPSIVAIHCYPSIVRKYPYNHLVFCCTVYPTLYIIIYVSVYYRILQAQLYILIFLIFHLGMYYKFHSVIQSYYTIMAIKQMDSLNQSLATDKLEEESSFDAQEFPQLFDQPVKVVQIEEPEVEEIINEEDEDRFDDEVVVEGEEEKIQEKIDEDGDQDYENIGVVNTQQFGDAESLDLNDEQRSQLNSNQGKKRVQKGQKDSINSKDYEAQEEDPPTPPVVIEIFNLQKYIESQPLVQPEDLISLEQNWLYLLVLAILTPSIFMITLDQYFKLQVLLPLILILFIYGCIAFIHIRFYQLEERQYVLNYSWVNQYYLTLTYWLADLFCPIILYRANQDFQRTFKRNRRSRLSLE